jgi:hypothetical protein
VPRAGVPRRGLTTDANSTLNIRRASFAERERVGDSAIGDGFHGRSVLNVGSRAAALHRGQRMSDAVKNPGASGVVSRPRR